MSDQDSDAEEINISIYINQEYDIDEDLDATKDIVDQIQWNSGNCSLEHLRVAIPVAFEQQNEIKQLFSRDRRWNIYEYAADGNHNEYKTLKKLLT